MKHIYTTLIFLQISLLALSSQTRKVLLIGIDGVRSDAFLQANTPNMDALLANATYTFDSWHTGITISGPSWSTILTGVNWNKHLVTGNSFSATNFSQYPPFPALAKQHKPNLHCSIVAEWHPLIDNITNALWDHAVKVPDGSNWPTADSAVIEIQVPDIDLLFAYFDKVDLTGHSSTFSTLNSNYINAIQDVDSAVGKILNALYARPTYGSEDWLILVITDHGGIFFGHGGNTADERHIWWIASGSAVAHQQISKPDPGTYNCNFNSTFNNSCVNDSLLKQSPVQADIAVTALHHLIYDSGVNPETNSSWNLDGKSWLLNSTGIHETGEDFISVYPNPASQSVTISGAADEFAVFDIAGREINNLNITRTSAGINLGVSSLANGTYFLHTRSGEKFRIKKFEVLK